MSRSRKLPKPRKVESAGPTGESREAALTEELSSLVALSRAKDEFLKHAAHDLRAPLSAILVWLDVLRRSAADKEKAGQAVDVIEESSRKLANQLDELQDVMSILSGKLKLDKRPLRLSLVIEDAVAAARQAAASRGIQVETLLEPDTRFVSGDASRLQQVVTNLLTNAIKFTPENGQIWVRLTGSGEQARLSVIDSGRGISQELLPHLFERAPRPASQGLSLARNPGLGLAIAHELVRLHGGTLEASSSGLGEGSTFTVTIPLRSDVPKVS